MDAAYVLQPICVEAGQPFQFYYGTWSGPIPTLATAIGDPLEITSSVRCAVEAVGNGSGTAATGCVGGGYGGGVAGVGLDGGGAGIFVVGHTW